MGIHWLQSFGMIDSGKFNKKNHSSQQIYILKELKQQG